MDPGSACAWPPVTQLSGGPWGRHVLSWGHWERAVAAVGFRRGWGPSAGGLGAVLEGARPAGWGSGPAPEWPWDHDRRA